jgi:hypothetical protein
MWTLFLIWLAGGFASLGLLQGILTVEKGGVDTEVKVMKFIQSWYSFGVLIGIIIAEIGKNLEEKK